MTGDIEIESSSKSFLYLQTATCKADLVPGR